MNKKGLLMIWCNSCGKYIRMHDSQFTGVCPLCGSLFIRMRCTRCGHKWNLRDPGKLSGTCPNPACKSVYWKRERILDPRTHRLIPVDKKHKTNDTGDE